MSGRTGLIISVFLLGMGCATAAGQIIYVDADATGANNGLSWADAYEYLQDALADASSGDEIRVAEGIYKPDEYSAHPNGTGYRTATFQLINGVAIRGGYAGFGEPDPNARDIDTYETILSGDLTNNDGPNFANYGDNSYHVVTGSGTDETAVLDGFTITSGSGNYNPGSGQLHTNQNNIILIPPPEPFYPKNWGGGIYNDSDSSPTLTNCTFIDNYAIKGGGAMYNRSGGSPTLTNCIFTRNRTKYRGGGIRNGPSTKPTLINCAFNENTAGWDGGGIHSYSGSTPNLINCAFIGNIAGDCGGGMSNYSASPTLTNCTFSGNVAGIHGGGMYDRHNKPTVINCVFSGNSAGSHGGGMMNTQNELTLLNCTFSSNSASQSGGGILNTGNSKSTLANCVFSNNEAGDHGGGIYYSYNNHSTLVNCTLNGNDSADVGGGIYNEQSDLTLTNCVFSGNLARDGGGMYNSYGTQTIANCTFMGNSAGSIGGGMQNSQSSTTIINCILWRNNAPDGAQISGIGTVSYSDVEGAWPGTGNIDADPCFADPNNGDYHLKSQAGRWEPSSASWVQDAVTSPCIDAGNPMSPIGYEPFPNGGVINMGAYGGTAEASKSYFGQPPCEIIVAGDINGDCKVNFIDFAMLAKNWLRTSFVESIFDFAVATRGALNLHGNIEIGFAGIFIDASVYIESEDANALEIIGNSHIAGDVFIINPDATVTLHGGQASIGGETGQDAIDNHVNFGAPSTEFPVPEPNYFRHYVQNTYDPNNVLAEYDNVRIPAGTDPIFPSVTFRGIVFIEAPNVVTFAGNTTIIGIIVGNGDLNDNSGTNQITFGGTVDSYPVTDLPEEFGELRNETGTFLMAPGFSAAFIGDFQTLNGAIAANGIEFFGNAGGTIDGSVINYSGSPMTLSGNSDLFFNRSGTAHIPAGFD